MVKLHETLKRPKSFRKLGEVVEGLAEKLWLDFAVGNRRPRKGGCRVARLTKNELVLPGVLRMSGVAPLRTPILPQNSPLLPSPLASFNLQLLSLIQYPPNQTNTQKPSKWSRLVSCPDLHLFSVSGEGSSLYRRFLSPGPRAPPGEGSSCFERVSPFSSNETTNTVNGVP